MAAVAAVALVGGLVWGLTSGGGSSVEAEARRQVEAFLRNGELVQAATVVEGAATGLSDADLFDLTNAVISVAAGRVATARQATDEIPAESLVRARAAEADAERLRQGGEIVAAIHEYQRAEDLYLSSGDPDRRVAELLSQARTGLLTGDLVAAAELGQLAAALAPEDGTVAALLTEVWDTAISESAAAKDLASTAGSEATPTFQDAVTLENEALSRENDPAGFVTALAALVRSAELFETARLGAEGARAARVTRAAGARDRAAQLFEAGQLADAVAVAEEGLSVTPRDRGLTNLIDTIISAAEARTAEAQGPARETGLTAALIEAEAIEAEGRVALEQGNFALAVGRFGGAADRYRQITESQTGELAQLIEQTTDLLNEGQLALAAEALGPVVGRNERDARVSELADGIRRAAAARASAAKRDADPWHPPTQPRPNKKRERSARQNRNDSLKPWRPTAGPSASMAKQQRRRV